MTPKQNAFYWREWGALSRRCQAEGWTLPDRHELHARALGADQSHLAFTNADFDKVLGVFRSYSQAENVDGQLRQLAQPTTRKMGRLEINLRCLALYVEDVEAYVGHICLAKFHVADWRDLSDVPRGSRFSQVEQLVFTLSARLNGKTGLRNQAGDTLAEMYHKAAVGMASTPSPFSSSTPQIPEPVAVGGDPDWNV